MRSEPSIGSTIVACSLRVRSKTRRLLSGSEAIARDVMSRIGVKATHSDLGCDAVKLLRSRKGEGRQDVHYDVPVYSVAITTYAVLIYLTDTLSTAFPKHSLADLRDTFTEGEIRPSSAALKKLARSEFHSTRVTRGTVAVIRGDVPHYAEANPDEADRYVLFLHFAPKPPLMLVAAGMRETTIQFARLHSEVKATQAGPRDAATD